MKPIENATHLPFRFGGVNVAYLETEQQGAMRRQADKLKSRRLGLSHIQDSFRDWLDSEEKLKRSGDLKTQNVLTSDVTAKNIIMSLPKYKSDLDKINCYLYQTSAKLDFDDVTLPGIQESPDQPIDQQSKEVLLSSRSPRYQSKAELWQQVRNSEWDRNQTRQPFENVPITLPNAKKQVFNHLCRKTINCGEWAEPDQELIDLIMNDRLSDLLKIPYPGYTGRKRCYDNHRQKTDDESQSCLFQSSSSVFHRKFPESEYSNPPYYGRKNSFSKTVGESDHISPFGNANPPIRTGTWVNYLYQRRWS